MHVRCSVCEKISLTDSGSGKWWIGSWATDGPPGPTTNLPELTEEEVGIWRMLHGDIVAERGPEVILSAYLQQLDLSPKMPPPGPNALRCMTVHGAKGLEFEHVYLIGMAQEVFPSVHALRNGPTSQEVEEERRSCFVAITRARETLTLTRSRTYFGYAKRASQFLGEMGLVAGGWRWEERPGRNQVAIRHEKVDNSRRLSTFSPSVAILSVRETPPTPLRTVSRPPMNHSEIVWPLEEIRRDVAEIGGGDRGDAAGRRGDDSPMTEAPRPSDQLREAGLGSFFRPRDAEAAGITYGELRRLEADGVVKREARGLYRRTEAELTRFHDIAAACARVPEAIVCLLTALVVHEIGTQLPPPSVDRQSRRGTGPRY